MSELADVTPHYEPPGPTYADRRRVENKIVYFTIAPLVYGCFICIAAPNKSYRRRSQQRTNPLIRGFDQLEKIHYYGRRLHTSAIRSARQITIFPLQHTLLGKKCPVSVFHPMISKYTDNLSLPAKHRQFRLITHGCNHR